jgi:hypothetical protein
MLNENISTIKDQHENFLKTINFLGNKHERTKYIWLMTEVKDKIIKCAVIYFRMSGAIPPLPNTPSWCGA